MRLAIVGSRTFSNYELFKQYLEEYEIDEIISGGAIGADKLAERYANEKNIPIIIILPDWSLGNMCDECIAFWDGESRGTRSTITLCAKANKKCKVVNTRA